MQRGDPTGGCPRGEAALLCLALQVPPAALVGRIRRIIKVRRVGAPLNAFFNDLHPGSLVVGVSCVQAALYAATRSWLSQGSSGLSPVRKTPKISGGSAALNTFLSPKHTGLVNPQ